MMSDLEKLKKKLTGDGAESDFVLQQRTAAERLDNIVEYTALIPFASNKEAFWDRFWLAGRTPEQLREIYQNAALAEDKLPVQQAFLLAVLQLLETPTLLFNTLPDRHRMLYYRDLLGFSPYKSQPDSVVVNVTLRRDTTEYLLPAGTAFDAGQDSAGNALTYLTDDRFLVTRQQLVQLCWTRQQADRWLICTALDSDNSISLPADGIRLFAATDNERELTQVMLLDLPATALNAEIQLKVVREPEDAHLPVVSLMSHADYLDFSRLSDNGDSTVYALSAESLRRSRAETPQAVKSPRLALRFPVGQVITAPTSLEVCVRNAQEISYLAQGGVGHINAFSYPFGATPHSGNAFELVLPAVFSQTGGELTIEPQWSGLPQEGFPRWYANYPSPPTDNSAFRVRIYLITPDGTQLQSEEQPLFSGESAPQGMPLRVTLPAAASVADATAYTVRVELTGPDFLHSVWQQDPVGKNAPWTPQVSGIDTRFQYALSRPAVTASLARLQTAEATPQVLYLGFSDVAPGDALSVYWSLNATDALNLSWLYYSQQGTWNSLAAVVQDNTGGLSGSGLWRATLPDDSAPGCGDPSFSDAYYWIKAVPADGETISPDTAPKLQAIIAGMVSATLNVGAGIDDRHFALALPAGTITQLVIPVAEISSISQPLPSTGGKAQETEGEMAARAATRIAHRQRAITWGNMRNMLMARYPQLFDVQFPDVEKLNHIPALLTQQLLVIPDSRYRDNDDPLRPAFSAGRLDEMSGWLTQYCSPWAEPELVNPLYIDVIARYQVIFSSGIGADYGYRQLAVWLQQRYMPWGENQQQAVTPGNQVDYYPLLATLQQSPLVQRVVSLTLARNGEEPQQQTIIAGDKEVLILIPISDGK